MNILPPVKEVKKFLIIFYVVGLTGFAIPFTRPLFLVLTPLALVLNIGLLLYYHKNWHFKIILIMLLIAVLTYFIEVIGVNTGKIFGVYTYGTVLGPKVFNTPLLIGINWLVLVYSMGILLQKITVHPLISSAIGAIGITIFDWVMEPVAIYTQMWVWEGDAIPLRNYLSWYLVAFVFLFVFRIWGSTTKNIIAPWLFFAQLTFFGALHLLIKFIAP